MTASTVTAGGPDDGGDRTGDEVATGAALRGPTTSSSTALRLRAGVPVLWRTPTQVQVGTDPRWATTLSDLTPSAARALAGAAPGADLRVLRSALEQEDVSPDEADLIVAHLHAGRLLVGSRDVDPGLDEDAWALLSDDGDPRPVTERRIRAKVRVTGLGRIGAALATTLAAAGIGVVELDDDGPVTRDDVGFGGLTARDLGASRRGAVARAMHDAAPTVRAVRPGRGPVDLVVLVERDVADPVRYRSLMEDDVDHLSVVVREASVLVGPLVVPGRTACLRCVDLHRTDVDPGWPALAAQLAARVPPPRRVETTLAAVASAVAAVQVLAHVDGRLGTVHAASLEIRLPEAMPQLIGWSTHPDCGCVGL